MLCNYSTVMVLRTLSVLMTLTQISMNNNLMNLCSKVVNVPRTVQVIVQATSGVLAKAIALPIPGAKVSTMERPYAMQEDNMNEYPVYPEDDGTDRPRNPYSPV